MLDRAPPSRSGRRKYWPIYEAAAEHGLPVGIHFGGSGGNPITGAGWPRSTSRTTPGMATAFQAQVISLVSRASSSGSRRSSRADRGRLRLAAAADVAAGRAWQLLRDEVPHLSGCPSEYIREHFWLTTQPMEEPQRPATSPSCSSSSAMDDRIMFATDYPHWDFDAPDAALPTRARRRRGGARSCAENARALYRLAGR